MHHVTLVTKSKLLFYLVTGFLPNGFAVVREKTLRYSFREAGFQPGSYSDEQVPK
jgi:hypothetical protein